MTTSDDQATARLDALEARWREVNNKQKEAITRLMIARQRVLELIDGTKVIPDGMKVAIRQALNADVDPDMARLIIDVLQEKQEKH